jgi:hypothetical protein
LLEEYLSLKDPNAHGMVLSTAGSGIRSKAKISSTSRSQTCRAYIGMHSDQNIHSPRCSTNLRQAGQYYSRSQSWISLIFPPDDASHNKEYEKLKGKKKLFLSEYSIQRLPSSVFPFSPAL